MPGLKRGVRGSGELATSEMFTPDGESEPLLRVQGLALGSGQAQSVRVLDILRCFICDGCSLRD